MRMGSYTGSSSFVEAACVERLVFLFELLAVVVFWVGATAVAVGGVGLGLAFTLVLGVELVAALVAALLVRLASGAAAAALAVVAGAATAGVMGAVGGVAVFGAVILGAAAGGATIRGA